MDIVLFEWSYSAGADGWFKPADAARPQALSKIATRIAERHLADITEVGHQILTSAKTAARVRFRHNSVNLEVIANINDAPRDDLLSAISDPRHVPNLAISAGQEVMSKVRTAFSDQRTPDESNATWDDLREMAAVVSRTSISKSRAPITVVVCGQELSIEPSPRKTEGQASSDNATAIGYCDGFIDSQLILRLRRPTDHRSIMDIKVPIETARELRSDLILAQLKNQLLKVSYLVGNTRSISGILISAEIINASILEDETS